MLHLYLELKEEVEDQDIKAAIHRRLKEKDAGYTALENLLGFNPLIVTVLPPGAFARYMEEMRASGADLAHIKPPRINPKEGVINRLLSS